MHSGVIIQTLGGMGHDLPEDGSYFLRQIAGKQHGEAFGSLFDGGVTPQVLNVLRMPPSNSQQALCPGDQQSSAMG